VTAPPTVAPAEIGLCVHEASHATSMVALDLLFRDVIVTPGGLLNGEVRGSRTAAARHPLRYAVVLLSGIVGESRLTGQPLQVLAESCGSVDVALADELVRTIHPAAAHQLIRRADRLVTANALAIAHCAATLQTDGRLTEGQVQQFVRAHNGRG
jgi:hypothetical protein